MQNVTREQIDILVALQDIDIKSVKIRAALDTLPAKLDALGSQLKESEQITLEMETAYSELKKTYRSNESDMQLNQSQIRKSNEKLVSVKTNKEYHAILKEIEDLNKKNSELEDEMIKSLDLMEEEEKRILEQKTKFEQIQEQVQKEKKAIDLKNKEEGKELDGLEKEWRSISEKVDPKLMKKFNGIREQIRGETISAVINEICQGCHMNIPPQLFNELQRYDSLRFCPHCHRIIYWKE